MTPDHIMRCPRCGCEEFHITVPGASRDNGTLICDVECSDCAEVFHPTDGFNRIPAEWFREGEAA